jgi:hypothetical protein
VFGQVSENHDALRAIVIGGFVSCVSERKLIVQQIKIVTTYTPSHVYDFSFSCLSFLLIFCQAGARRKTSTIAAPNIEILLNN